MREYPFTEGNQAQPNTLFMVGHMDPNPPAGLSRMFNSIGSSYEHRVYGSVGDWGYRAGVTQFVGEALADQEYQFTALFYGGNSRLRLNSVQKSSANPGNEQCDGITAMNGGSGNDAAKYWKELIFYNDDQSANFAAIEADQIAGLEVS